ncbi:TrbC/VirB2 family protein [Asticcacaulis sp.]|uniref:TrbC/VirB2 family protein n=1 Tax=Asticcacaulis sp. TaxID=1872648 RepID=UPI003F7C6E0D
MTPQAEKRIARLGYLTGFCMALATPAFAQVTQLTNGLNWIKGTITGIGVVVIIIAIMWTGIQMMFQHAKWSQVAHIFFGGILVGGAAAIGPQLFGGGATS